MWYWDSLPLPSLLVIDPTWASPPLSYGDTPALPLATDAWYMRMYVSATGK